MDSAEIGQEAFKKVLGASDKASYFLNQFDFHKQPFEILDILLVAVLIYWVYILLKETRAMRILYGIVVLIIIMLLGRLLQLQALNFILTYVLAALVVAIPVVFQPELRSALERLGRTKFVGEFGGLKNDKLQEVVTEILSTIDFLSQNKQGAIIVLTRQTGLKDIIQSGVLLNAKISKQLLITIFSPKTPLHDGAVIISGSNIIAANCWLPLTEQEFKYDLGTRHRAAAGITTDTDAIVLVVSEETGKISLAVSGNLTTDLKTSQLKDFLFKMLQHKIEGVTS
ncbi:MAG: diadenylate cyclase CdaA [Patescibacteria group bacterium]